MFRTLTLVSGALWMLGTLGTRTWTSATGPNSPANPKILFRHTNDFFSFNTKDMSYFLGKNWDYLFGELIFLFSKTSLTCFASTQEMSLHVYVRASVYFFLPSRFCFSFFEKNCPICKKR